MSNEYMRTVSRSGAANLDQGLRSYMLGIYNYMALGLGLTGLVATLVASSPALLQAIYGSPLQFIVMLAPVGFVFFLSFRLHAIQASTAQMLFWAYSGLMGLSLSWIFLAYTGASVAKVFFITAGTFGAMSLYGYTTKKDLTGLGSFLLMGLIGLILASLVNLFVKSSAFEFVISAIGVLIFTGLTAYDTQVIKSEYIEGEDREIMMKKSIMGALRLYLDFINLFLHLLRFLGDRR
ncbi:MAG: Bax inhibitor-1/YccA family protein [Candidatus Paracaedimonas acanthamoebae]|uniref:Bax inhibitor-1/YccA family protein n=1 Tax=Candidatus Paracaedimonas acanthamoebae TaxID=244581 RepID=A0A8J7PWQ3_9PROT|nr:Bax inhibitor-1/YccA family protein [Candidatus Paracaedimonas acanthamoebae]